MNNFMAIAGGGLFAGGLCALGGFTPGVGMIIAGIALGIGALVGNR